MKKKSIIYLITFMFIGSIGFYITYRMTYYNLTKKDLLQKEKLENQKKDSDNIKKTDTKSLTIETAEPVAENQKQSQEDVLEVDSKNQERINSSTKLVIQHIYKGDNHQEEEELIPPYYLINLTRNQLERYTHDYIENLTEEEKAKQLINFELVSFSSSKVVLKKVYNSNYQDYYTVYIDSQLNKIVIKNPDGSIREILNTPVSILPESERNELIKPGKKIYSEEELLQLIENYSS